MTPASLLSALLSFAPPGDGATEPPAPSVGTVAPDDAEYQAALQRVREAQQLANDDAERGSVRLRDALQVLESFGPRLGKDPEGLDLRTNALLTLARALLATEDADGARDVMDAAIRTSRGDPLPAKEFGPGLHALYKERSGVLDKQPRATISVSCKIPCRVYINERPTQEKTDKLMPGSYRVWVEAADGSQDPVKANVELAGNDVENIDYGVAPIVDIGPVDPPKKPKRLRMMPRWAEIVLMTAGAAGVGTGAALLAIDGKCPDGANPMDPEACPQIYITKTAGIATLAIGGAVFLTGTITLVVDEVRVGRARGNEVALMWTMRF